MTASSAPLQKLHGPNFGGVVIDGHNRYEIAQKHGLEFETIEREFASREDVKIWIIKNQFGRRNLSAYDRSRLALELEPLISEKAKENLKTAEPGIRGGSPLQKSEKANTQKELATIAGVSHDTIAKVKTIEQKATPEVKEKLSSGEVSINQAYKEIKQAGPGVWGDEAATYFMRIRSKAARGREDAGM